jgi:RNA polymerase sigma-70 factor (ECF subfamily)
MVQPAFVSTSSTTEDSGIFRIHRPRIDATCDDETLIDAMIENCPAAWREFQRRYDRLIFRCITKVTKRFSAVSADDVHEIHAMLFVSLVAHDRAKLRTYDKERGSRFSSWIGLLAIHCAYDFLRSLRREPAREVLSDDLELSSDLPDPYEAAARRERSDITARVLAGFSQRDRDFATLYFGEGLPPDEVARAMSISVKTVYSKRHKIQTRLEALLEAAGLAA